ncbi:MAG: hypothetical protein CSB01_01445 [Bacteroidia bacterium]|nr:MAG: hypothetical protein CSB01_01445 [Bacteroidia bacterium]
MGKEKVSVTETTNEVTVSIDVTEELKGAVQKEKTQLNEPIQLTAEERAEFEAFKAHKKAQQEAQRRKDERATYKKMVDNELETTMKELISLSEQLYAFKQKVYENWHSILEIKAEMLEMEGKSKVRKSNTFTHSNGKLRLVLGNNRIDSYNDLAEDGIQMVKDYISSLASDEKSGMLVTAVLDLLSKDKNGTLKASRVLKLDQMAEESNNEQFKEGVRIIKEAYSPLDSKQYVRAWVKDEKNEWRPVPLSVTDALDIEAINTEKEEDNE